MSNLIGFAIGFVIVVSVIFWLLIRWGKRLDKWERGEVAGPPPWII